MPLNSLEQREAKEDRKLRLSQAARLRAERARLAELRAERARLDAITAREAAEREEALAAAYAEALAELQAEHARRRAAVVFAAPCSQCGAQAGVPCHFTTATPAGVTRYHMVRTQDTQEGGEE